MNTLAYAPDDKDVSAIVLFSQPLKTVCIESDSIAKKDKSFIVGTRFLKLLLTLVFQKRFISY